MSKFSLKSISMVTDQAEASFDTVELSKSIRERDKVEFKNLVDFPPWLDWVDHWGKTCQGLIDQFKAEGLIETVKEFEEVLSWYQSTHTYELARISERKTSK